MPNLAQLLLTWFDAQARDLPWRTSTDPYHIWVSEIMLQQTQVETVIPYYNRWLARFPTVQALAAAPLDEVLHLWQGLGYYARARNFHAAAQQVVTEFGGQFPTSAAKWQTLKGVGRYTAGAIASIAYGERTPVVDGNVKRVLARLYNLETDIGTRTGEAELWALAEPLVPAQRPGDYNQALMELGATVCRPQQPNCLNCPLAAHCLAYQRGNQHLRPVKTPRAPTPHYPTTAVIVWRNNQVLLARRPTNKLLGGLWEFPNGRQGPAESLPACAQRHLHEALGLEVQVGGQVLTLKHAFTHFKITVHVFLADWQAGEPQTQPVTEFAWVAPADLQRYPMGKTDHQIANWLTNQPTQSASKST